MMAFAAQSGCRTRIALAAACWRVAALSLLPTALSATVYHVGPGQAYDAIGGVPWESLAAGDSVMIHWRSEPYREKWVICRVGSPAAPIVVRGLPSSAGERPVVSGENATTRPQLNYWNRERGVVKIGGASVPPDCMPAHIIIEGLRIRSARPLHLRRRHGLLLQRLGGVRREGRASGLSGLRVR